MLGEGRNPRVLQVIVCVFTNRYAEIGFIIIMQVSWHHNLF